MSVSPQRRVLVIEDEPLIAMVLEMSIEWLGHVVVGPVRSLGEAMALADSDDYDCAIVDVNIVGGLSWPVTTLLEARRRPYVLASGYGDWSLPEHLRDRPRLTKPYTRQQLEDGIVMLVARCAPDDGGKACV